MCDFKVFGLQISQEFLTFLNGNLGLSDTARSTFVFDDKGNYIRSQMVTVRHEIHITIIIIIIIIMNTSVCW